MNFSSTDEQKELYERVLHLARRQRETPENNPAAPEIPDTAAGPGGTRWKEWAQAGITGLCAPESHGGLGLGALETALCIEALGRGCEDMGLVFSVCAHLFACVMPVAEGADDSVKDEILPRLARGEAVGANALSEDQAGSDAFAIKTTARRDGDVYVLDGTKNYVTNAPVADFVIVYAVTNAAHGFMGLSAFVLPGDIPGLRFGQPIKKMGLETAPLASLYLEDCRVPVANRIGPEGAGAHIFRGSMQWERACLFAAYVGMMERQLEQSIGYARARKQFGRAIGRNQAISHRIADMKLRLESARLLLYRSCWKFDQGERSDLDISLAKVAISEAAVESSRAALHIHGGLGYTREMNFERELRDSIPAAIFSGTSEMQRDIIAGELGL